jgi:hypothetical protein
MRHRIRISTLTGVAGIALLAACRSGDKATGPDPLGKPVITQVNGVTEPVGLVGMTVMIEGSSLGDSSRGKVYFLGSGGARIQASAAHSDCTNTFIIVTVPTGTADSSRGWVETTGGVSDRFRSHSSRAGRSARATSPGARRARSAAAPGLGALTVKVSRGSSKGSWVYTVGGANAANVAGNAVYRAEVMPNGSLDTWSAMTSQPTARAYHALVAATPSTARIDTTVAAYVYALGESTRAVRRRHRAVHACRTRWRPHDVAEHDAAPRRRSQRRRRGIPRIPLCGGGASGTNQPTASAYRAEVHPDGTLGTWQSVGSLPTATAYHSMVSFGPYVYVVGGDNGTVAPTLNTMSGTETNAAYVGRIDMRTGRYPRGLR